MARQASALTIAARKLLAQSNGTITASEAVPALAKLGFDNVDPHAFNQIKANWTARQNKNGTTDPKADKPASKADKKKDKPAKKKAKPTVAVTQEDAIAYVRENGGMKAAKQNIQRQIALVRVAEEALLALA